MGDELSLQHEAELFESAARLTDPAERRAFLERTCPQNLIAQERIEKLVALRLDAEKFFAVANGLGSLLVDENVNRAKN